LVPNPTRDFVRVQFNQISNGPVTFTLMNIQGQILRQWSTDVQQGDGEEQIDLSELNKGLYFIQLNNGVESISKRVLRL
ncbi:MAG: hypothetical protein ACI9VN_002250, partial [Patescibacteria group bacterium]